MAKSITDKYEDASSSQEREARSERKIRKFRAELEETVHARKEDTVEEDEARKAKGRGAGGAAGLAEEESGRRGDSAKDSSGGHRGKESLEQKQG